MPRWYNVPVKSLVRHAQMVLDITRSFIGRFQLGVKLAENLLQGLAANIGQYIQATSVDGSRVIGKIECDNNDVFVFIHTLNDYIYIYP